MGKSTSSKNCTTLWSKANYLPHNTTRTTKDLAKPGSQKLCVNCGVSDD